MANNNVIIGVHHGGTNIYIGQAGAKPVSIYTSPIAAIVQKQVVLTIFAGQIPKNYIAISILTKEMTTPCNGNVFKHFCYSRLNIYSRGTAKKGYSPKFNDFIRKMKLLSYEYLFPLRQANMRYAAGLYL